MCSILLKMKCPIKSVDKYVTMGCEKINPAIKYDYQTVSVKASSKMPMRKLSHCHPNFIEIIHKLADTLCLESFEYVVEFGCEDVDSFLSGIYKVQLKGSRDGQKIKTNVIMKWHPDPKTRSSFREAYRREFVFYRLITPKLLEIQRSFKNMEGLKLKFPNCVYASAEYDHEAIAIQGLEEGNFHLYNRFQKLDLQHVLLVMKNLAKLHGLAFALAKINPVEFDAIRGICAKDVQYPTPGSVPESLKSFYDASVNVVSDTVYKDRLRQFGPNLLSVLNKCTQTGPFSTICHADCWNNNILYKYNKGGRPIDVIFIDFQLTRVASPVTDIAYFLYMSTDEDLLSKHYDHILDIYYKTLTAVLRQCDLDVNEVYPQRIFEEHLKEYSVFGLIEALISMMIITAQHEKALKMTELKYEHANGSLSESDLQDSLLFVERVNGVVSDFFGRNYLLDAVLNK